jgi:hypothetical protein
VRKKVQANNCNKLSVQTASDGSKSQKREAAERHDSYVSNHFTRKWLSDKGDSPESRHTLKGTVSERIPFRWEMRIRNEQGLLTQVKGENKRPAEPQTGWEYEVNLAQAVIHLLDRGGIEAKSRCCTALACVKAASETEKECANHKERPM